MESDNPWQVDTIHSFWYLKCPECNFDSKDEDIFEDHAVENHPLSFVLFSNAFKEESSNNFRDKVLHSSKTDMSYKDQSDKNIKIEDNKLGLNSDDDLNEHFDDNFENTMKPIKQHKSINKQH